MSRVDGTLSREDPCESSLCSRYDCSGCETSACVVCARGAEVFYVADVIVGSGEDLPSSVVVGPLAMSRENDLATVSSSVDVSCCVGNEL